jgi:23S rRNA (guanosine2251-2'-O)-methyltransferase
VRAAIAAGVAQRVVVAKNARERLQQVVDEARARRVHVSEESPEALEELARDARHQGVVAVCAPYPYLDLETLIERSPAEGARFVALDEVTDPRNFGAIVRSAVAFGAHGIIVPEHRSAAVTTTASRAAAGTTELAKIARVTNLSRALGTLADVGFDVIGLDVDGTESVDQYVVEPRGFVLVVGSEGRGLRRLVRERCTTLLRIPTADSVESLNASVAASIALYALRPR